MPMTSRQILDLIADERRGRKGALAHARHYGGTHGGRVLAGPERAFLDDLDARDVAPVEVYQHPGEMARRKPLQQTELGAADLAWIQRLPTDPTQVPFEDAVQLASLAANVSKMKNPSDARLLESVWTPVREVHDRGAAEVALRNASRPIPMVPATAVATLADAIARETDGLTSEEVIARANRLVSETRRTLEAGRDDAKYAARQRIDELTEAATARRAVTR